MALKIETKMVQVEVVAVEKKGENLRVAEKLGKFSRMAAKNGAGDKSGYYGH